ncbi:MAG: archease [Candidatus Diapherotrites archaeon]|nr:archease [Candidatus Diapherotrites archaeon]
MIHLFARGEAIDVKKHRLKTEVKGATYSGLRIIGKKGNYMAQCILDV